jgi:hypothetical protein
MLIAMDGAERGVMDDRLDTRGLSIGAGYRHLMARLRKCNMVYGLMRLQALKQTVRCENVIAPDHLLLGQLALQGRVAQVPEVLFFRRENRPPETAHARKNRVIHDMDPHSARRRIHKPWAALVLEMIGAHLRAVFRSDLGPADKILCAGAVIFFLSLRFFSRQA